MKHVDHTAIINKSFNIITVILITRYICIFQDISRFSTLECSRNVRFKARMLRVTSRFTPKSNTYSLFSIILCAIPFSKECTEFKYMLLPFYCWRHQRYIVGICKAPNIHVTNVTTCDTFLYGVK